MALWGQAANIAQLLGVDLFGIISLITKRAQTVRQNVDACRELSIRASLIKDRLERLRENSYLFAYPDTSTAIQGLRRTLFQAHKLIQACQYSSYAYKFCMGCELIHQLESVKMEMDIYNQHLSAVLLEIPYLTVVISNDERKNWNTEGKQDGLQLPAAGSCASNWNSDDSNDRGGYLEQIQLQRVPGKFTEVYLPENQISRWCFWCPWKETITAPTVSMLIDQNTTGLTKFSFSQLAHATNYFSLENKIGFGGSSTVYKGRLNIGLEVAVKRAAHEGGIPFSHFETELELIPRLQHTNIIKLLGYCIQRREMILVFEYMPNGSLDSFMIESSKIHGATAAEAPLDWSKRRRIAEGIAQGAMYLHKLCEPRIIHRDLKPGNILLDSELNPKICDFGIARPLKQGANVDCTRIVMGSRGFIAPEYKGGGCLSTKSDVYSFGVTLLQIISGKRLPPPPLALSPESRDYGPLNKWAWELWVAERLMEFIDPWLHGEAQKAEIMRWVHIALLCIQEPPEKRPSMWDVLLMMNCVNMILQGPEQPAYY
ncbi:hypothetical protein ACP4OV_002283 [Aristida adscensionis]